MTLKNDLVEQEVEDMVKHALLFSLSVSPGLVGLKHDEELLDKLVNIFHINGNMYFLYTLFVLQNLVPLLGDHVADHESLVRFLKANVLAADLGEELYRFLEDTQSKSMLSPADKQHVRDNVHLQALVRNGTANKLIELKVALRQLRSCNEEYESVDELTHQLIMLLSNHHIHPTFDIIRYSLLGHCSSLLDDSLPVSEELINRLVKVGGGIVWEIFTFLTEMKLLGSHFTNEKALLVAVCRRQMAYQADKQKTKAFLVKTLGKLVRPRELLDFYKQGRAGSLTSDFLEKVVGSGYSEGAKNKNAGKLAAEVAALYWDTLREGGTEGLTRLLQLKAEGKVSEMKIPYPPREQDHDRSNMTPSGGFFDRVMCSMGELLRNPKQKRLNAIEIAEEMGGEDEDTLAPLAPSPKLGSAIGKPVLMRKESLGLKHYRESDLVRNSVVEENIVEAAANSKMCKWITTCTSLVPGFSMYQLSTYLPRLIERVGGREKCATALLRLCAKEMSFSDPEALEKAVTDYADASPELALAEFISVNQLLRAPSPEEVLQSTLGHTDLAFSTVRDKNFKKMVTHMMSIAQDNIRFDIMWKKLNARCEDSGVSSSGGEAQVVTLPLLTEHLGDINKTLGEAEVIELAVRFCGLDRNSGCGDGGEKEVVVLDKDKVRLLIPFVLYTAYAARATTSSSVSGGSSSPKSSSPSKLVDCHLEFTRLRNVLRNVFDMSDIEVGDM